MRSDRIEGFQKKKVRERVRLSRRVERRVKDYSAAAAGVGALAFVSPVHATIATTPLNLTVPLHTSKTLNLAAQSILSIYNVNHVTGEGSAFNGVFASSFGPNDAVFGNLAAGGRGQRLGPVAGGASIPAALARFTNSRTLVSSSRSSEGLVLSNFTGFLGNTKYLGFSFGTGPTLHYGWLQLNITQNENHTYSVTMVQAAYEQCPGQPIMAGTTSGGATCTVPSTPAPNSLWLMALGAAGLAGIETLRRRRRTA